MSCIYTSKHEPDPFDPRDVLAFVLCPDEVFAPGADDDELAAVAEIIGPAKAEAILRWHEHHVAARLS